MAKRALGISALAILAVVFTLCLTTCNTTDKTYTFSGTPYASTTNAPSGCYAYGKLVAGPGVSVSSPARYSGQSTAFSSGTATFSISDIKKGTYTAYVFIDKNGSGGSMPDSGEKYTYDDITIKGDLTITVSTYDWYTYY
jgi:hypothetical protein